MNVVITTANFCEEAMDKLRSLGFTPIRYEGASIGAGAPDDAVFDAVKDADIIIAGTETYRASLLSRLTRLKLISRNGIGYDSIDINALEKEGIGLTRTVGYVEGAVAEHVMAYILYFARRIDEQNRLMHEHHWSKKLQPGAKGSTLGLVGFGGIGKEVARRAVPFGMKVLYFCRHPNPDDETKFNVKYSPLEKLLAESDYVVACVPLTEQTYHLFDEKTIGQMKKGSCLINISRGSVVDEYALVKSLKSGHLAHCAVDVYTHEPCTDSPLLEFPGAILTPHTASSTVENQREMNFAALNNAVNYMSNKIERKFVVVQGNRK